MILEKMINGELIVDNFAGGGGASTGIEIATGYSVDIAINHDPEAIKMHKANHPSTKHYCENVWDIDPLQVCNEHPVALAWFSPDCKHFSKAKGGKPKDKNIRGLAWVSLRWAAQLIPQMHKVDKSTICQCTGLKDKNGKLIWENDVVKVCWQNNEAQCEEIAQVAWDEFGYYPWLDEYHCDGCDLFNEVLEIEIIGNKFDNPELLESEV